VIDFLCGVGATLGALYLYHHFSGSTPLMTFLTTLEGRIKTMLTDALNELKAAADADKAKAVAEAEAKAAGAAQAQEVADEQTVRDFTAANFPQG